MGADLQRVNSLLSHNRDSFQQLENCGGAGPVVSRQFLAWRSVISDSTPEGCAGRHVYMCVCIFLSFQFISKGGSQKTK